MCEGRSGQTVRLRRADAAGEQTIEGSDILAATGRTPNTAGIGLDVAGVALDGRGYIAVNERLETSAPGVWAIGECAGSPQFTHVSFDDFRVIRDNLAGVGRTTRDRLVPYCMFTDPPLARVGLSERDAQRQGVAVRVAKLPIAAVLRTRTIGETKGFMKALVDARQRPHSRLRDARRRRPARSWPWCRLPCWRACHTPACAMPSSRTRRWRRVLAHCCRGCRRSGCCGWTLGGRATRMPVVPARELTSS